MRQLIKSCAKMLRREKEGVAAVEFAVIVPLLLIMAVGMVDLGMGLYDNMQTQNAAQAGADYALIHLTAWNKDAVKTAIKNASSLSGIGASPDPYSFCGCPGSGGVTQVNCATGICTGMSVGCYIRTSATYTYNTVLPYSKILPFLQKQYVLTSNSTVRVNEAAACSKYS
jgi:Flp pilus assembly pilin Flp